MKKIVYFLIFVLMCSLVSADLGITINGKTSDDVIETNPGDQMNFQIAIPAGVQIIGKEAKSDNAAVQTLLNEYMDIGSNEVKEEEQFLKHSMAMPSLLPAGNPTIKLTLFYTLDGQKKEYSETFKLKIGGSKLLGYITEHSSEETINALVDEFNPVPPKKLSRDLVQADLTGLNIEGIGMDDILNGNYVTEKIKTVTKKEESTIAQMVEAIESVKGKAEIKKLSKNIQLATVRELNVYKVKHKETGAETIVSKIIVSVTPSINMKNIEVIEVIPKTVAKDVSELVFSDNVQVIEKDPIVKWSLSHTPKEHPKEYSYTVNKELTDIESTTAAAGERNSIWSRFLGWVGGFFV